MKNVSEFIVDQLEQSGYISEEEKKAYEYCYTYIIENIKYDVIVLSLSLFLHRFMVTGIFLIFFNFLRNLSGGYHAETRSMCNIISYSIFAGLILGSEFLISKRISILFLIFTFIIAYLSPMENGKKKFSKELKQENKKKVWMILSVQMVLFFIFFFGGKLLYSYALLYCNMIIGFSLLIQKYKNMRKEMTQRRIE